MIKKQNLQMYAQLILLTSILIFSFFPIFANAQDFVPCNGPDCRACDLVSMVNSILKWLIGVMFVIFAGVAAVAGFGLVTSGGNPSALQAAKDKMVNAVIGLIIVLAAWLLVDTIMQALLKGTGGTINGRFWGEIECAAQTSATTLPVVPSSSQSPTGSGLGEATVLNALSSVGVSAVSSGGCTDPSNRTCTGLAGMQQETVDGIIAMAEACPSCNLVVTAGTEVGHTNACHVNGTCADIDCRSSTGGCSVEQINTIDNAASLRGMNAVYEVKTTSRKNQLVEAGVDPSAIEVVNWITGEHFSLYSNSQ